MSPSFNLMGLMARRVAHECLGLEDVKLDLTSIGWNPGGRLHAVYEAWVAGHLVQVELRQLSSTRILGQPMRPFSVSGPRLLIFRATSIRWNYQKFYG